MTPAPGASRDSALFADAVVDKILAGYSAVEPPPEVIRVWAARSAEPLPASRFLWLPAPAWAALAALLLLILGIGWYRARLRASDTRARLAAGEKTVLVPLNPASVSPLTDREKQLIQLLQTNPAALATQPPPPAKGNKHP